MTTTKGAAPSALATPSRSAALAVFAGGNLIGIPALLAIWLLRKPALIAGPPYWAYVTLIVTSIIGDVAGRHWYERRPESILRQQTRVFVGVAVTTTILYASGWGSVLAIAYGICAIQMLAQVRGIDWRTVLGWCVVGIFAGELAIHFGIAPHMLSDARSHVIAAVGAGLLAAVLWVLSGTFAERDYNEQALRDRERRLAREVATDSLTQLLNRRAFTDALERACAAGEPALLAFVDLNNFKDINDSFGHQMGDQVLVEVACRLRGVVREGDLIARFGGDEFVILVKSSRDEADAGRLVERIWAALAEPWPMIAPNRVTASVGVVDDRDGSRSPEDLLREADKAMYARKHGMSADGSMAAMTSRALAHHRSAMDGMQGVFVVLRAIRDNDGAMVDFEIVEANSIMRAIFAGVCDELVGTRLSALDPIGDNPRLDALYREAVVSGTHLNAKCRVKLADGRRRWSDVNVVTVDRDVIAVLASDITPEVEAHLDGERERARFASLITRSSDLACVVDADGEIVYAPPWGTSFLGYRGDELGAPWSRVAPADAEIAAAWFDEVRSLPVGNRARSLVVRFVARDGNIHTCDVTAENMLSDLSVGGIVLNAHDVSALVEAEARLAAVADAVSDVIAICEPDGRMTWVSGAVRTQLGLDPDELVGLSAFDVIHPDDRAAIERSLATLVADEDGPPAPLELRVRGGDGAYRWFEATGTNQLDDPSIRGLVVSLRDITDRRVSEDALRVAATCDDLTGLPNRRALLDRTQSAIEDARRTHDVVGMVFVDLDRFKLVNDGLGHEAGDQLLVLVAGRIAGAIRVEDVVARLGSDEFVVLCPSASDVDAIKVVAGRIADALTGAFHVVGNEVFVGASIGMSVSSGSESSIELLRYADTAMYRAKAEGSSHIEIFDTRMQSNAARRLDLESALRNAVARGEFVARYQPIVDLDTGRVLSLEALVRWNRRGVGLVRPDEFIPVAEEAGIVKEIGARMLFAATADCRRWQDIAPGVGVSVNVSVRQFESDDLVRDVQRALTVSRLAPELLTLEITESVMLEHTSHHAAIMRRIRDLGIHLSLDDFGSGYSSLTYLRLLPIDSIKIDRSFLQSLGAQLRADATLRAIVTLGTDHDLDVVAEGIDTVAKLAAVRAVGCQRGQGFLFAEPMALEATLAYLAFAIDPAVANVERARDRRGVVDVTYDDARRIPG